MQQNEMQKQSADMFGEFMDVTLQFSEEELQAVHGIIPMTQELFDRCAGKCEELGGVRQLEELIGEFPEQYRSYRERLQSPGKNSGDTEPGSAEDGSGSEASLRGDSVWQGINSQLEKIRRS